MSALKLYRCNICGNMELSMIDSGVTPVCCGQDMEELQANTVDADGEKHVPVIERNGDKVTVKIGAAPHPMLAEHRIDWIALTDGKHTQIKGLHVDDGPEAVFAINSNAGDKLSAYAFCNLHGLWSAEA